MGCLQACGNVQFITMTYTALWLNILQEKLQDTAESSVTIQSALSPLVEVNPIHVAILLMIAVAAVVYQLLKLRKDTYRLIEENKPPAPATP